jgi:metal-responsive CopG/Arc/MetJ family transcriptional regulator
MKTAISLSDELFEAVEKLVRRSGRSRSELYAEALREYVARHSPDEVTEALNAVVEQVGSSEEDERFIWASARRVLTSSEW